MAQENSDFNVKSPTDQFYTIEYNSQYDHRIMLKSYKESPNIVFYI